MKSRDGCLQFTKRSKSMKTVVETCSRSRWDTFGRFCDKVDLLLKYFDYIANFVDTILLYIYVFCFDICKLFLKFLILT